jgi:hypothetical protein
MARIAQSLPRGKALAARQEVRQRLLESGLLAPMAQGARIAITAGSRGMACLVELVAGIADAVKEAGGEPFVIPAMGSHGGATAEGQLEILRRLGLEQNSIGAPLRATMDTLPLGTAENGAVAHLDCLAAAADGIIVLGRTQGHPEEEGGELASGLLKMSTIGLGKQRGAQEAHSHGLWESVRAVPEVQLARARILCGIAMVENGYREPIAIDVVPGRYEAFCESDRRLLQLARQHHARLPFERLDVLVVDKLGKDISGAGMDPHVIGLRRSGTAHSGPEFKRIVALSLTAASLGNGLGIGMADFTTRRFAEAYDPFATYVNLLTASEPHSNTREGPLPLALASDKEAIEVALYSALVGNQPRLCRIRSTAELCEMWVSPALLPEVEQNPNLRIVSPPEPPDFDGQGNLS